MKLKTITFITLILIASLALIGTASANGSIEIGKQTGYYNNSFEIYLDGELVGYTGEVIEDVISPGAHTITVKDPEHNFAPVISYTSSHFKGNYYTQTMYFNREGILHVNSEPSDANIYVNGERIENKTDAIVLVEYITAKPSMYNITLTKDGYSPVTQMVNVSNPDFYTKYIESIDFTLEKDPNYVDETANAAIEEKKETAQSPGFTGLVSIGLIGCAGFLLRKKTK
jgi:hypothetical protein